MSMAVLVAMVVVVVMALIVAVTVVVRMGRHRRIHSTRSLGGRQLPGWISGQFDTSPCDFVDGVGGGCEHQLKLSFSFEQRRVPAARVQGIETQAGMQTE